MTRRVAAAALTGLVAAVLFVSPTRAEIAVPKGLLGQKATLPGLALGGPVTLTADTLSYDDNTGIVLAEGNVEVGFGNRAVRADRIRYDASTGEAEFMGRVHYKDEGDEFSFDRMVINIRTELGVLYNGSIRLSTNNYQLTSERFEKTGPKSFALRKGTLTTCPCDPEPDWKLKVGRSRVTIDGYAVAKDVTFNIRGVPVIWLPWAAFPVKLTRQSGFLLPSFAQSGSRGYELTLPYYWAISRWSDATITLDTMSARGYRPEVEYRFVLNDASEGAARASYYEDRQTRTARYRLYGENVFRYGATWTANAKWDVVSDDRYYVDLVDPDILRTSRAVPSRAFVADHGNHSSQALAVVWAQDHQGVPTDNVVQRLPEYSATLLPQQLGRTGIAAGADASATYFYRHGDNRELRGRGLASLSRPFILYPSVSLTPYAALDLLGSHLTSDRTAATPVDADRVLPVAGADLVAVLHRSFASTGGSRYVHTVQPSAGFRWIPDVDQDDIPLTDQWSRIRPQRQFAFALAQRLTRIGKGAGPSEVAVLELEWAYDLQKETSTRTPYVDPVQPFARTLREQIDLGIGQPSRGGERASDLYARFRVGPAPRWKLGGEALFDPGVADLTMMSVSGEWTRDKEDRVALSYGVTRNLAEDVTGILAFRPFRPLGLRAEASYSLKNSELSDGTLTITTYPRSDCWSIGLVYHKKTRPDETSVKLTFALKGLGEFGK